MGGDVMTGDRAETIRMLRESAAGFAAKESPVARARALRGTNPDFDRTFWTKLAEQGWTGLLVAEQFGGFGLGFAEMASVVEQFAAHIAPEPLVATGVFTSRLLHYCPETKLASDLLSSLAGGTVIGAVAWQEDPLQTNPCASKSIAVREGGGLRLSGKKRFVRPGTACDGFIVSALTEDELALYWIPYGVDGLTVNTELQADGTYSASLHFDRVCVDTYQCLSRGKKAERALLGAYDEALIMTSVELLAISRAMLAMTKEYLCTRVQFGKPIGSFQALQHRAVDLLIQQELTSAVVDKAIRLLDDNVADGERTAIASRAKARASEAAMHIGREAIHMHGAIGFTDEFDLGLYFNRSLVLSAWLGNGLGHRRRFATQFPLRSAVAE